MRTMMMLIALAALATNGCNKELPLDGLPCPCATGWMCCDQAQICVPEGASCSLIPDGGTDADPAATCVPRDTAPQASYSIEYLGPVGDAPFAPGVPTTLRYRVVGSSSPAEPIILRAYANNELLRPSSSNDPLWGATLEPAADPVLRPEPGSMEFTVTVTPPASGAHESMVVVAGRLCNETEWRVSTHQRLLVGTAPDVADPDVAPMPLTTSAMLEYDDSFYWLASGPINYTMRVSNFGMSDRTIDVAVEPYLQEDPSLPAWQLIPGPETRTGVSVSPAGYKDFLWHFQRNGGSVWSIVVFRVRDSASQRLVAEAYLPLRINNP